MLYETKPFKNTPALNAVNDFYGITFPPLGRKSSKLISGKTKGSSFRDAKRSLKEAGDHVNACAKPY